jgi:integration host factor subunit beta
MTRTELISSIAKLFSQLSRQDVEVSVKVILDTLATRLAKRNRIEIRGFGSFTVQTRPPRKGRNPKTGESVLVPEKSVPHFKPGIELRERVNH